MLSNVRVGLSRVSQLGDKLGLRYRDLLVALVTHPGKVVEGVRRHSGRSMRKFEGAVRASERASARVPAQRPPENFDELLDEMTAQMGVLELSRSPRLLRIGVADVDLLSAVLFLALRVPGAQLSLDGLATSLGAPQVKQAIQTCKIAEITFSNRRMGTRRVQVEGYAPVGPAKWLSANDANTIMRGYYGEALDRPGHLRAIDILGAPVLSDRTEDFEIDAVYTWVNHADPDWKAMHAEWTSRGKSSPAAAQADDADALTRFHNNDELRYSLRSLEANTPWLRRIFVFSNCTPPAWLRTDHPKVTWVRHEEVIPAEYLPTFNSHVIESYLHRIPGLAERFIYLNDDFVITQEMTKGDFFTGTGMSCTRLEGYGMVSGPLRAGDPDYLNAARNGAAAIREALGFAPTRLHQHVPYALLRPVLEEIEERFSAPIEAFRPNRFRQTSDLNITSFLYHHYALGTGRAVDSPRESLLIKSNALMWQKRLFQASTGEYSFLCFNEGGAEAPGADWHEAVQSFLKSRFPGPAEWETSAPTSREP